MSDNKKDLDMISEDSIDNYYSSETPEKIIEPKIIPKPSPKKLTTRYDLKNDFLYELKRDYDKPIKGLLYLLSIFISVKILIDLIYVFKTLF